MGCTNRQCGCQCSTRCELARLLACLWPPTSHACSLAQVKEARKATVESKPDILGVRGPVWNETVALNPGKHHGKFSHALLSNTLTPELLNSTVGWDRGRGREALEAACVTHQTRHHRQGDMGEAQGDGGV